jgi:hypothetical protein
MLVDAKGMIAFKGHPANRKDLKADLDAMLAGTPLTGEGCAPEGGAAGEGGDAPAEEAKFPDGFKEGADCEAIGKQLDAFRDEGCKAMQAAAGDNAKGIQLFTNCFTIGSFLEAIWEFCLFSWSVSTLTCGTSFWSTTFSCQWGPCKHSIKICF